MTTPRKLSELDPRTLANGHVVRLRDGESPHAIRGNDLDGWTKIIAELLPGDRFYLVPRIEFMPLRPEPMSFRNPDYGVPWFGVDTTHRYPDPLRGIRRLRDEFLIELDDHRFPADSLKPIDDAADRFAQLEIDKDAP